MNRLYSALITLAGVLLITPPAHAMQPEDSGAPPEMVVKEKKHKPVNVPSTFGSSRLRDWRVVDGRNLVIELDDGRKFKASLMNYCHGLRFTDVLGFSTQGPYELDKWTTLHLPDGERCYIKELQPYVEEEKTGQGKRTG